MIDIENYAFYTVNIDYLEYLYSVDSEVYYSSTYANTVKPFIGIIVGIGKYKYFVPLSSMKEKHKKWKNISNEHFLIYEMLGEKKEKSILSVIDIKKMIPIPNGYYQKIVFDELEDKKYKNLLKKEYAFCLKIKEKLIIKIEKLYKKQKEKGIVREKHCNFLKLETAMKEWIKSKE